MSTALVSKEKARITVSLLLSMPEVTYFRATKPSRKADTLMLSDSTQQLSSPTARNQPTHSTELLRI
jgi:hypothetical protein